MSEHDLRRKDDAAIARLEQKLDDFMSRFDEWRETHERWALGQKEEIVARIQAIEKFVQRVDTPVRLIGWASVTMFVAIFGGIGVKVIKWVENHWQ